MTNDKLSSLSNIVSPRNALLGRCRKKNGTTIFKDNCFCHTV